MKSVARILGLSFLMYVYFIVVVVAQKPPQSQGPAISDALKIKFFKAQNQAIQTADAAQQAAQTAQQAKAEYEGVVKELADTCGAGFQPQIDPKTKDPICAAVPQAPKAEKK